MKKRMEGRKMVKLKCLSSRMKNGDIEGDWVTIGVIVDKLPPRWASEPLSYIYARTYIRT